MEEKITEEELCQYAKQLSKSGRFDHIDIIPEENIIEVYEGINSYTIFYGKSWDFVLNPTISSRQIELLEKNPELFVCLNRRYFFDNQDSRIFSEEKTNKLLRAATKGLEKMPKSAERVEIQEKIMAKVNGIKQEVKEIENFNKNI